MDSNDDGMPSRDVDRPAREVVSRRSSWPRVAGLFVLSAAGTVTAVLTGSTDAVIGVVLPLLPYLPR